MTLDTCIKRYEIWASDDRISPDIREEHKQIVKWLNSYKKLLQQDTVPFDFELYQAGLMDLPKGMIEVLNEIKAEIDEQYDRVYSYNISCAEGLEMALEIINKYTESEDKE